MALSNIGGGSQIGDGNTAEIQMGVQAAPQTATVTATLSVAQTTGGILVVSPVTTAATLTWPTAAALDAALGNAKVNSTFEQTVINLGTSTGIVTMAVGSGITAVGNLLVGITGTAAGYPGTGLFEFRKTGDGAWTVYRMA